LTKKTIKEVKKEIKNTTILGFESKSEKSEEKVPEKNKFSNPFGNSNGLGLIEASKV